MSYVVTMKRSVLKAIGKLPEPVQDRFRVLTKVLEADGPTGPHAWRNYSKLGGNEYHCHLNYSHVACWRPEKKTIIIEVYYMSAAVKIRHTERETARPGVILRFRPRTPSRIIKHIEQEYRDYLIDGDDELVVWEETELARTIDARMTPGKYLRNLRGAHGLTQQEIAEKTGHRPAYVSDMENDRRTISRVTARKLAELFSVSPALFI